MIDELDRARRTLIQKSHVMPRSVLAAVGLGAAFGLGILAGGVGQARGAAPSDADALATARAKSVALEQKQAQLKLAFPAELLAPEAAPAAIVAAAPKPAAASAKPAAASAPAATSAPAPVAPMPARTAPAPVARPAPEPAPADDRDPPTRADDTPRPSLQAALARVLGGAPPAASTPPTPKPKSFALQVASLPQRAPADELMKKLAAQGLNSRVVVGDVGGRDVYRVRVGAFADRDKAEAAKGKLAMPSFIVSE